MLDAQVGVGVDAHEAVNRGGQLGNVGGRKKGSGRSGTSSATEDKFDTGAEKGS